MDETKPAAANRYAVERVTLQEDNSEWTPSSSGEWRVIDRASGAVVLTFAWSRSEDHTEWPEREFYRGPYSVTVDEPAGEVIVGYTLEHDTGVTFEGAPRPARTERVKIPSGV